MTAALAAVGHNSPPDKFTLFADHIGELMEQAKQFLDGEGVQTQQQADDVSALINMLRRAQKDADEARKEEKKPHDDAASAVQAKWKPILDRAGLASTTAKNALAPFLRKQEEAQRAAAQAAAEEARKLAEAAAQAAQQVSASDLSALEDARALQERAAKADKTAKRLDKAKVHATGGERAVGLRSVWSACLSDPIAALKHYRERQPDGLKQWLLDQAQADVRAGSRAIPGFTITEERVAV